MLRLNGKTDYFYLYNGLGDITGLVDSSNQVVVRYQYNSWGKVTSTQDTSGVSLATLNPFCYRKYVYDPETGLYCLGSRYYDPEVGRFVNADDTDVIFASAYRTGASVSTALEAVGLFDVFAARGMLVLHSAYIVTSAGEAILFSGPSGIGKSTQAALWQRCAGARVVNGDRALVDVGKKTANGIFYAGTSGISENVTAPIRAIVLLGQSSENRVFIPSPRVAFAGVLSQCAYYDWDVSSAEKMTACAARLVSDVPVLRMDCLPNATAVEALHDQLGGI